MGWQSRQEVPPLESVWRALANAGVIFVLGRFVPRRRRSNRIAGQRNLLRTFPPGLSLASLGTPRSWLAMTHLHSTLAIHFAKNFAALVAGGCKQARLQLCCGRVLRKVQRTNAALAGM